MKPIIQTKRGIGGNCLAACLASILELSLDEVPDLAPPECFTDFSVQPRLRREWLARHGIEYVEIDIKGQRFHWTSGAVPSGDVLFAVESRNAELRAKGFGHFVVGRVREIDDRIEYLVVHDPVGDLAPGYDISAVGIFCKIV